LNEMRWKLKSFREWILTWGRDSQRGRESFLEGSRALFPPRKFYTEQMYVLLRTQLRSHVDTQPVKRYKSYAIYIRY